ncbi:Leucine-rich repeat protein kinase family protein [Rhynchospora pubera]|uniref:Leucine-rich repeat protein kinase family protein n=1 Tax=Rhynchospora pubera TaxID=906938 RepID=A0AAV8FZA8_9POAL|nr:Leucine-rich repeat protein kinase family protein [Rhynchospora pubera]KAJ4796212.1 Leucine-rich repeat protein kinase family protein [Rhynchospora pubera]
MLLRPPLMASRALSYLVIVSLLSFLSPPINGDIASDTQALLSFKAVVRPSLPWNTSVSTCSWPGVGCSGNTITVLRLPGSSLSGEIPSGTLGKLTGLRTLSLRLNELSGQLPSDLSSLTELRNLYLQGNRFTGEFPSFLSSLKNLVRLNLAGNNFTGSIPPSLNNLTRLATLYLENNRLVGEIPDLSNAPLAQFNVSYNNLNGSIPKKLRSMPESSFLGTGLCGGPLGPCPGEPVPSPGGAPAGAPGTGGETGDNGTKEKKKKLSGGAIAGIAIGCVIGALILLALVVLLCRRGAGGRKTAAVPPKVPDVGTNGVRSVPASGNGSAYVGSGGAGGGGAALAGAAVAAGAAANQKEKQLVFLNGKEAFDLEDLLRASAEVLGKGTFGTAYKAVMETGSSVAVKRLKDVELGEVEFRQKVEQIGAIKDDKYVVPLMAYYYSRDEKLLVYEYMPMGSLSALLHGNRGSGHTPLNWETRFSIALSAARGLSHIHAAGPTSSHGNIKSSNILLTNNYDARVSDHGLSTLVGPVPSSPARVSGYRAPEVTDVRRVSQKADVYSFGVLLLELLTGKAPTQTLLNEEGVDLPRWVQSVVREEWTSEVFDMELLRYGNVEDEMVQLLQLAIDCAAQHPDSRPHMADVAARIEEIRRTGSTTATAGPPQPESIDGDDMSSIRTE